MVDRLPDEPPAPATPGADAPVMIVEAWSDLICPWCWIGKRRFERALADFAERDSIRVVHRAFRLMPRQAAQPIEVAMASRFRPGTDVPQMLRQVEQMAATEGLTYRLSGTQVGDTRDAHRLALYAAGQGRQAEMVERLYRGYFSEHASLFDRESLLDLASDAGLDRDAALAVLESDDYAGEVVEDQQRVATFGASGVPFYLIDGRVSVSGGQPPDHFLASLRHAWTDRTKRQDAAAETSMTCGPDACAAPR